MTPPDADNLPPQQGTPDAAPDAPLPASFPGHEPWNVSPWPDAPQAFYEPPPRKRRVKLPIVLFVATCLSTFWTGACVDVDAGRLLPWAPIFAGPTAVWEVVALGWSGGLTYMLAVMAILLAHEMGHFLQAVRYRVPASLPYFIPMPLTPIGTMGAVIGMQGSRANRRELFDIGISGPIAGLIVALPVAWYGIRFAPVVPIAPGDWGLQDPLLLKLIGRWFHPPLAEGQCLQLNPLYLAGWVGMLITGLNMLPVSQLDGGHVAYTLFGSRAHWIARGTVLAAVMFIVASGQYNWSPMLLLVTFIGLSHPPTSNDRVPIGLGRRVLGIASLAIPVLCLTPVPLR